MRRRDEAIDEMQQLCDRNGLRVSDLMDITALVIISVTNQKDMTFCLSSIRRGPMD